MSFPRLSDAARLLPLLRGHVAAAAAPHPLPAGLRVELLPIVEDGIFGYELVPDRPASVYLLVGCNALGTPVARKTRYPIDDGRMLQLAAVDGRTLSRAERVVRFRPRQCDLPFDDWPSAAAAAWSELAALFPGRPRQPACLRPTRNASLEAALKIAHAHLARWDPAIDFFGLPREAEQGFALRSPGGGHGELVFQRPDIWMLRWKSPPDAVYESWSVVVHEADEARNSGRGDVAS